MSAATATLELVVETDAHEGPVYVPNERALYFTTVRREHVAIKRLSLADRRVSVVREDANMANGMALAPDGRLVVCEQGTLTQPARITLVDRHTGEAETVVEATADGLRLNSPNDIVVANDGAIWFTAPSYGWLQGFRPEPRVPDRVYRCDPAGRLNVVAESLDKPNGLAFSPDERILYLGDNGAPHHLLAFDVEDDARLAHRRVVAISAPEHPDGIKVDRAGRIYASFTAGIQVFAPNGDLIGEIELPGAVNFTFGGPDHNVLFITTDDAVWASVLAVTGPTRTRGV